MLNLDPAALMAAPSPDDTGGSGRGGRRGGPLGARAGDMGPAAAAVPQGRRAGRGPISRWPILAVLQRRWPAADRVALRRLVLEGRVLVNRAEANLKRTVRGGDEVLVDLPEGMTEPPHFRRKPSGEAPELPVLHEDGACIVVHKPAGMFTVPSRDGEDAGLHGLLGSLRPEDDLRIAHRLDRNTSGAILLVKGADAARAADRAFQEGAMGKKYVALVEGRVARGELVVDRPLGPDPRRPGFVVAGKPGDKKVRPAKTHVRVVERFRRHTLVELVPATGRGHQLRVHMASLGHSIAGDIGYGGRELALSHIKRGYKPRADRPERPLLRRQFLHAEELAGPWLGQPGEGQEWCATAPLPDDLQRVLDKLRRFAPEGRSVVRGDEVI